MPPAALRVDPRTTEVFLLLLVYLYSINMGWALQEAQARGSGWKRCLCRLLLDLVTHLILWPCFVCDDVKLLAWLPLIATAAVSCGSSCGQGTAVSPGRRTAAVGIWQLRLEFKLSVSWGDQRLYYAVWAGDGVWKLNSGAFLTWKNTGCLLKWRLPASIFM